MAGKLLQRGRFLSLVLLFTGSLTFEALSQSLDTTNYWLRVNRGFAKCANLNSFAGEAEWFTDDFTVTNTISRRGEIFAWIQYGNTGSNTSSCGAGLFRHDTTTNRWIRVATSLNGSPNWFASNNTDIFLYTNFPDRGLYRLTNDYVGSPNGWQRIGGFRGNELPGYACEGNNFVGMPGDFLQIVGDTIYLLQEWPCSGQNQIMKLFVGGDYIVNPLTDIFRDLIGDHPGQGITANWLRSAGGGVNRMSAVDPIGGIFRYFYTAQFMGSTFEIPDFMWTYDRRAISSASYSGLQPFRNATATMGGFLYYACDDGQNGFELWKSDGTLGGTTLVRDINTGQNLESREGHRRVPKDFLVIGSTLYFTAWGPEGYELYKTDGTSSGTVMVKNIFTGSANNLAQSGNPGPKVAAGSTLFFAATSTSGRELWLSDGTDAGTVQVADLNPGGNSSDPQNITVVGTTVLFSAIGATGGRELYKSEPPYNSVTLVRDIRSGSSNSDPTSFTVIGNTLFFTADDGVNGRELWKCESPYNSTTTSLIRNIWPGVGTSNSKNLFAYGNRLLFQASDSVNGAELWISSAPYDAANTLLLSNIRTTALLGSNPGQFIQIGDTVLFRAQNNTGGFELWKTAGTAATTRLVADINLGSGSSSPQYLTNVSGTLYFTADNGSDGRELYRISAPFIQSSLSQLNIRAGRDAADPVNLTALGTQVLFAANDGTNGVELWRCVNASTPSLVRNISKSNYPRGWTNISRGPDYNNLTGSSNPIKTSDPGYDPYDSDTWVGLRRANNPINGWGNYGTLFTSFDKKQVYFTTQTGAYRWVGSGHEYINGTREAGLSLFPTNNGVMQLTRSGASIVQGAVTARLGNTDFYPTCAHSGLSSLNTPDDGRTWYVVKRDMKNPANCTWTSGNSAQFGIYRLRIPSERAGATRNIHIERAGFFGGAGDDHPIGSGWAGKSGGKRNFFVAGNYGTYNSTLKARKPAADITFNSGGYTTVTSAQAQILRFNNRGDTLLSIIYLGTNATETIEDFEVVPRAKAGIGLRMVVAGKFGVVCLDSLGQFIWRIPSASLPGNTADKLMVDIDANGHVVVIRRNGANFNWRWRIFDESGTAISAEATIGREFVQDIAIKNDTVAVTGFRNGCLPSTTPRCFGAGGNTGSCSGAEVQTCYIWYFLPPTSPTATPQMYARTYDYQDGAMGRDVADTRGYFINFGEDGNLYYMGESAGSESIYRWDGTENKTVELNSVRLGICDINNPLENGSISSAGLINVSSDDLTNTASAHITFFGRVNYRQPTQAGYCAIQRGKWIIPRLPDGKSNTFTVSNARGYITADRNGDIYVIGSSASEFAGRDVQKVNGQTIGAYSGDATIYMVDNQFRPKFWGILGAPTGGPNGRAGSGNGRSIAVRDSLVAYVLEHDTGDMFCFTPNQASTPFTPTSRTLNDGYMAFFYSDLVNHANNDTIQETVVPGDSIISPDLLSVKANFRATRLTTCQFPAANNTTVFVDSVTILNPTKFTGWTWTMRWDFGPGATLVSGNAAFNGTVNQGLNGYVDPTVRWSSSGLKSVKLRMVGKHATFDSIVVEEVKFNYINVLSNTASLTSISGPGLVCNGGVYVYEATVDQTLAWAITSYNWTVPSGATILAGQGSRTLRVKMGPNSGNIGVAGVIACGTTPTITRAVTVNVPQFEALMVCNSFSLTSGEQAIFNELRNRGYNVTVREDNGYDTLESFCRNIIIITSTVDSAQIGRRFRNINIPVVVMRSDLLAPMGMVGSVRGTDYGVATNQTQVNIVFSGSHDLKGTLSNGNTSVFSAVQPKNMGWGNPNNNAVKIAQVGSNTAQITNFGFTSGTTMAGSFIAPARRVFVFPADRPAIDSLNTNGQILVNRALCWATGNCDNPSITARPISRTTWTPGDTLALRFNTVGTFNAGNQFIAQFSDRWGDFNSPTNANAITLTGTNPSGTIIIDPLPNLVPGINYSLRVISTNPVSYGLPITGITIMDTASGTPKILFVCSANQPSNQTLAVNDTALFSYLRKGFGLPVDFCRISDVTNQRMVGTRLVVVSTSVDVSTANNTNWDILRNTRQPVILLNGGRLQHNPPSSSGLGMATSNNSNGCTGTAQFERRQIVVYKDSLFTQGMDGWTYFYDIAEPFGRTLNCIPQTSLPSTARVFARNHFLNDGDNVVLFAYERGDAMSFGSANGRRVFLPHNLSSNRMLQLQPAAVQILERAVLWALGRQLRTLSAPTTTAGGPFCEGATFNLNFSAQGDFDTTNRFVAQLSDPTGNFSAPGYPLQIGQITSRVAASLPVTIPTGLPAGSGYRLRVTSTSPTITSEALTDTTFFIEVDDRALSKRTTWTAPSIDKNNETFSNIMRTVDYPGQANVGWSYLEVNGFGSSSNTFRFQPTIPQTSNFEVFAIWPVLANRASTTFRVVHAAGSTNVTVQNNVNGNRWVSLGRFTFNAGNAGFVELDGTQNLARVDAIRWVRNPNHPNPAPNFGTRNFAIGDVWTGAVSNSWYNPANWNLCSATPTGIPDSLSNVVIPAALCGSCFSPTISGGQARVRNLNVAAGMGNLTLTNNATLTVYGTLSNADTVYLRNNPTLKGKGANLFAFTNTGWIYGDSVYTIQGNITNSGVIYYRNFGGSNPVNISQLNNTNTGIFTTPTNRTVIVGTLNSLNQVNVQSAARLQGIININAGTISISPRSTLAGTLNLNTGNCTFSPVTSGDFYTFEGDINIGSSGVMFLNGNMPYRIRVTGTLTNNGTFTASQGNDADRHLITYAGGFINNGRLELNIGSGARAYNFVHNGLVNNGLIITTGRTDGGDVFLSGGTLTNNGTIQLSNSGTDRWAFFNDLINRGSIFISKRNFEARNVTNFSGGIIEIAKNSTTSSKTVNFWNLTNEGIVRIGEQTGNTCPSLTVNANNVRNLATGTFTVGTITSGAITTRQTNFTGSYENLGTGTINGNVAFVSKASRRQNITGLGTISGMFTLNNRFLGDTLLTNLEPTQMNLQAYGTWFNNGGGTRLNSTGYSYFSPGTTTTPAIAADSLVIRPNFQTDGNYNVQVWFATNANNCNPTRYFIFRNGLVDSVSVNQTLAGNNGTWVSLGTFYFRNDGSERIMLGGRPRTCSLAADGFRFIYVSGSTQREKGGCYLGSPVTLNGGVTLTNGKFYMQDANVTLGTATITGASANNYFVSNNSSAGGRLFRTVETPITLFPIGLDTNYTPLTLSNGNSGVYGVGVLNGVRETVTSGSFACTNTVNRTWMVSNPSSTTGATLQLQWDNPLNEQTGFVRASSSLFGGTSSWANLGSATLSGTGPYVAQRTSVNFGTDAYFHLASGSLATCDKTWVGGVVSNPRGWNEPNNWSPPGAPNNFSTVVLNDATYSPVISSGIAQCFDFRHLSDSLTISGGELQVFGNFRKSNGAIFLAPGGTVSMRGVSPSSIVGSNNFFDLSIQTSSGVNLPNTLTTIANDLIIGTGARLLMDSTSSEVRVGRHLDNSLGGFFRPSSGTVVMNGTNAQEIRGVMRFRNLTISNSAGVTTTANDSISNNLNFTAGTLSIGNNDLVINPAATITGASATQYVRVNNTLNGGALSRVVGNSPVAFPVGTTSYTPVTLNNGLNKVHRVRVFNGVLAQATNGASFTEKAVNRTWFVQPDFSADNSIIDDGDASGVSFVGTVPSAVVSAGDPQYGGGSRCYNTNAVGDSGVYTPNIQTPGMYEVFIWYHWPTCGNACSDVRYMVYHANGRTTVSVNQNGNFGRWVSLGTYQFNVGNNRGNASLRVRGSCFNASGNKVTFDAARFLYRGPTTGTDITLQWNNSEELPAFNTTKAKLTTSVGDGEDWQFAQTTTFSGSGPKTANSTINRFPYFTIGGWGTNAWTGAFDSSWNDIRNWSLFVPDENDDVVINASVTSNRGPRVSTGTVTCRNLTLMGGNNGNLRVSGGNLNVFGNITNSGTIFHSAGKISMHGTNAATISGTNSFNRLEIRNSAGVSLPNGTTTVRDSLIISGSGRLSLTGGTLNVNGHLRFANSSSRFIQEDGALVVRGNFDNQVGGQIQTSTTGGSIEFAGTAAQFITGRNSFRNFTVSNTTTSGVILPNDSTTVTRDLTINAGGRISMSNGSLTLGNNVFNNGTMNFTGGAVNFTGSGNQDISGGSNPVFNHLRINKPAGTFTFPTRTTTVNGTLSLLGGTTALGPNSILNANGTVVTRNTGVFNMSGGTFSIRGNLDNRNSGQLNFLDGTVQLNGPQKAQIQGYAEFNNLTIDKAIAGQDTVICGGLKINNTLSLNNGVLYNPTEEVIELATNATVPVESNNRRIIGRVRQSRSVSGSPVVFAGMGISIDPGTNNLGSVTAQRIAGLNQNGTSYVASPIIPAAKGLDAIWRIEPENQPSSSVNLILSWLSAVDNSNNTALPMYVYRREAPYTGDWERLSGTYTASARTLNVATSTFSEWTASDIDNPLPIVLSSFEGKYNDAADAIDLNWITSVEINNHYFSIEKANDNQNLERIGTVRGAGNTTSLTRYTFTDKFPRLGLNFYRLRQTDFDGQNSVSHSIAVVVGLEGVTCMFRLYPNPSSGKVIADAIGLLGNGDATLELYDLSGKYIRAYKGLAKDGILQKMELDLTSLPKGLYMVRLKTEQDVITQKLELK